MLFLLILFKREGENLFLRRKEGSHKKSALKELTNILPRSPMHHPLSPRFQCTQIPRICLNSKCICQNFKYVCLKVWIYLSILCQTDQNFALQPNGHGHWSHFMIGSWLNLPPLWKFWFNLGNILPKSGKYFAKIWEIFCQNLRNIFPKSEKYFSKIWEIFEVKSK